MGKSSGGNNAPNLADVLQITGAQEDAINRALQRSAELNLFDVSTPFGQQRFVGTPGQPNFQQQITLPGQSQQLLNRQRQLGLEQFSTFRPIFEQTIGGTNLAESAGDVEQATYQRGLNLLQPTFDRERQRVENNLQQRGIPRNSEAYRREIDDLTRRQGAQLENLALSAVGAGRGEQTRQVQTDIQRRAQLANELGLFGFGAQARVPQFQPVPQFQSQAPDTLGAFGILNQNAQADAARRAQQQGSALGGLFNIGSAVISGLPF